MGGISFKTDRTLNLLVNVQPVACAAQHGFYARPRLRRDADDGTWQFLDGGDVLMADAMVVAFSNVVTLDPSVRELADLPLGYRASRLDVNSPWHREPSA